MSARQPFLPSRPASRALNPGDDVGATRVASSNHPSDAIDSAELGVKYQPPQGNLTRLPKAILTPNQPENRSRPQHLQF
jgi:hypothetical protein